jgi:hypothetical protein
MSELRDSFIQESGAVLCVSWRRKRSVIPKHGNTRLARANNFPGPQSRT